jgi:hypothetical protein
VLLFGGSEGGLTTSMAAALPLGAYFPQLVNGVIAGCPARW